MQDFVTSISEVADCNQMNTPHLTFPMIPDKNGKGPLSFYHGKNVFRIKINTYSPSLAPEYIWLVAMHIDKLKNGPKEKFC